MDPLPHQIAGRQALQRIKPINAVTFLRPINNRPFTRRFTAQRAGVAQPLCFRQIGFAAAQCFCPFHQSRFAFCKIAIQKGILGYVHQRSDNLQIAGRIFQGAAQYMYELR